MESITSFLPLSSSLVQVCAPLIVSVVYPFGQYRTHSVEMFFASNIKEKPGRQRSHSEIEASHDPHLASEHAIEK